MKKAFIVFILVSLLTFTACSSKGIQENNTSNNNAPNVETTNSKLEKEKVKVNTNFKPISPKTVPKLSSEQKSKVDSKLNATLSKVDKTLNALQNVQEIDLSSLDN